MPVAAPQNNYFVLFYIAYLREVEDPISNAAHPCDGGNCLPELQFQMIVVFTGKTIGKQIALTIKPFVIGAIKSFFAQSAARKVLSAGLPAHLQAALEPGETDENGKPVPLITLSSGEKHKITNETQKQTHLMPYEDTFQDFCDRIIQFGYIVLFAPAFPLAPFLAFINNVIEIRTSGLKFCSGFQRPISKPQQGIGSWLGVMNILGFLAVLTNASMVRLLYQPRGRPPSKPLKLPY